MDEQHVREVVAKFAGEYVPTAEFRHHQEQHARRHERARRLLEPSHIPELTEAELQELFFDSDAFQFWRNPARELQRRVQKYGLDGLRRALGRLVEAGERGAGPDDLAEIWQMQGLGVLLSTELLAYRFPDRYWTYSENVTLPALEVLGEDIRAGLPWGQKANQHVYFALAPHLAQVRDALAAAGVPGADYLLTDIFFIWIRDSYAKTLVTVEFDAPALERGMNFFDAECRDSAEWARWEEDGRHRYAIVRDGRRYPVKEVVRRATGKTGFTSAQVRPRIQKLGFEVIELREEAPQCWVFQCRPDLYDLSEKLREYQQDWFRVGSYRTALKVGDRVLLWQAGEQRGIYGVGTLLSEAYAFGDGEFAVDVRYDGRLAQPLLAEALAQDPVLAGLQVLKVPRGTVFPVRPEEWAVLEPRLGALLPVGARIDRPRPVAEEKQPRPVRELLQSSFARKGLTFTPWQVATFYTALQTKGFVILSGISGTGKTKLAQHLAGLLPARVAPAIAPEEGIEVTVQPYMLRHNRFIIPKKGARLMEIPGPGESREIRLRFDGSEETCRLFHGSYERATYLLVSLRGRARTWFAQTFAEGDTFHVRPETDDDGKTVALTVAAEGTGDGVAGGDQPGAPAASSAGRDNYLFVSVRPDWRDGKSLLGYFNPLTRTYEWTPFLRFLTRAAASFRDGDGLAWFLVLDEMNLAHVEHYLADVLSVLESGRDEDGWTNESLRFVYPDDAEGDLPPAEIRLPPNLYLVGTVNVDETTHAISPKVLDRAFTLELTEADFANYPVLGEDAGNGADPTPGERRVVLDHFTCATRFARIDKAANYELVSRHPELRERLQVLNGVLRPHQLHFGYRVFDEIAAFLVSAEQNGLYEPDDLGGLDAAFDAAVLMKVLPKFHGSRARLETPLKAVLAWCKDPTSPNPAAIEDALQEPESGADLTRALEDIEFPMARTAERVRRMLWQLHAEGFASFG